MPVLQAWNNGVIFTRRELRGGCFLLLKKDDLFAQKQASKVVKICELTMHG